MTTRSPTPPDAARELQNLLVDLYDTVRHHDDVRPMDAIRRTIDAIIAAGWSPPTTGAGGEDGGAVSDLKDLLAAAYEMGCHDVHENYREDSDPDFTEAASDYATNEIHALEATQPALLAALAPKPGAAQAGGETPPPPEPPATASGRMDLGDLFFHAADQTWWKAENGRLVSTEPPSVARDGGIIQKPADDRSVGNDATPAVAGRAEAIEAGAKAICEEEFYEGAWELCADRLRDKFRANARAAFSALSLTAPGEPAADGGEAS